MRRAVKSVAAVAPKGWLLMLTSRWTQSISIVQPTVELVSMPITVRRAGPIVVGWRERRKRLGVDKPVVSFLIEIKVIIPEERGFAKCRSCV